MIDINETKRISREMAKEALDATSEEYRSSASATIAVNALALPEMHKARTVMLYVSVDKEPATLALIVKLLEAGKKVCLPRCADFAADGSRISEERSLEARRIKSIEHLVPGPYGIPEPVADDSISPVVKPSKIDLVILPCVACGTDCSRLGHGAGYYDRFLKELKRDTFKAALCYDKILLEGIPMDEHDEYMNAVITEKTVYRWRP